MDDMFEVMKESDVVFTATGSEVPALLLQQLSDELHPH